MKSKKGIKSFFFQINSQEQLFVVERCFHTLTVLKHIYINNFIRETSYQATERERLPDVSTLSVSTSEL